MNEMQKNLAAALKQRDEDIRFNEHMASFRGRCRSCGSQKSHLRSTPWGIKDGYWQEELCRRCYTWAMKPLTGRDYKGG